MKEMEIISVFCLPEKELLGNTAAVVLLKEPLSAREMQALAGDLNQPATTFLWPFEDDSSFHVRWFAPDAEIGLCGHGTLAALAFLRAHKKRLMLHYQQGIITGICLGQDSAAMEMAAIPVEKVLEVPEALSAGLNVAIKGYYQTSDKNIVEVEDEDTVRLIEPDFAKLRELETFGYCITAPGREVDFVSRTLVPHVKQLEDHATGSSHAALTPYWSKRLQKNELTALQLSPRGGAFQCQMLNTAKVVLTGRYRLVSKGHVSL